jgi:hypothetical protein
MTCQGLVNYSFGTADGGMVQIFDVKNGNGVTANVPIAATDNPNSFLTGLNVINEQVSNLQTSTTGGFAMAIWSAQATDSVLTYPGGGSSTTRGLDEIFPAYSTVYTFNLNAQLGMESNYVSLESDKINKEIASSQPFTASARYFNNIPSTPASPGPAATGTVNGDGTVIWFGRARKSV